MYEPVLGLMVIMDYSGLFSNLKALINKSNAAICPALPVKKLKYIR